MQLFVVIPVHNRAAYTRGCLESLARQDDRAFDVVVVDDGSTDETPMLLADEFAWVHTVRGDGNLWWSGATNLGVRYALERGATHIMTLNDDTRPPSNFINAMKGHAASHPSALVGALETDADTGAVVYAGERIDWLRAAYVPLADDVATADRSGLHRVTHFPGRGLVIPRAVYDTVGLYDADHFPQAVADYDFTHRAHRAGFEIYCAWDVDLPVYPCESGGVLLRRNYSLGNYVKHLFGIKGAGNLPTFVRYGWRNAPRRYLVPFLVVGVARRVGGYLRDWVRHAAKGADDR